MTGAQVHWKFFLGRFMFFRSDQKGGPSYILPKESFSYFRCETMNVDDKIVVGDSGEGIAEVGGGTDE